MLSTTPDLAELTNPDAYSWRPLRILGIYRMAIVAAVVLAFVGSQSTPWMRASLPQLFFDVALGYLALAVVVYVLSLRRWPAFKWQVYAQATLDVTAITLLVYAGGSLDSGLGTLMVVAIAGVSILMNMRAALFFASLASILLLSLQVWSHLQTGRPDVGYTQAALVGIAVFITASVGSLLSRRARHNQLLADQRGHDLKSLEALNSYIVQRLQSGVVVVDAWGRIRLLNRMSWTLLGRPARVKDVALASVSTTLAETIAQWRQGLAIGARRLVPAGPEVDLRLRPLGPHGSQGVLIFLEDRSATLTKVQQAKLASLGQLSANIAHEVRNPLGAISHAAQLLGESPALADADKRLLAIILKQSARLNTLVESVLQMSRREPPRRQTIALGSFLARFKQELREQYPHDDYRLDLAVVPASLTTEFDADHLGQVLTNLCRNAMVHGRRAGRTLAIAIRAYAVDRGAIIDVVDDGKGIDPDTARHMFEPFFTTASNGTGLGLYLCQELCESNGARLSLMPAAVGTCFRIECAHNDNEDEA